MFKYFLENNLISSKQSGFKPGDSSINQLIAITHDIFKGFDDGLEVRDVFNVSKPFDKVWYEGLIHKLRRNGICDNLLQLFLSFLIAENNRSC